MSLGGLALDIGVLVDAAIVMVENGYRHLSEQPAQPSERDRVRILIDAAKQVGPALFFSLIIIRKSDITIHPGPLFARAAAVLEVP
jgi:Cu(I)/Ag(I) efflux system membrane protein CusA/SilA